MQHQHQQHHKVSGSIEYIDNAQTFPCRDVMAQEIRCTTAAGSVPSDTEVVVTIDNATLSFGVVFSYRNNPNVTAVFPSNTVPSGGITLTFTGLNMDVVQQPFLEVYGAMGSRLVSHCHCMYLLSPCVQTSLCVVATPTITACTYSPPVYRPASVL